MTARPPFLDDDERRLVIDLIDRVVPDAEVWVFGSRATGRVRRGSDLDLLFDRPARLTWQQRADLHDAFEASSLPYRVDLVERASLAADLVERVLSERVLLTGIPSDIPSGTRSTGEVMAARGPASS
jgi:uncharacterized protein